MHVVAFVNSGIQAFLGPVLGGMCVLASLICVFLLIYSGLMYITSSGNVTKLQLAKKNLIRALVGLVIVFAAASFGFILNHAYGSSYGTVTHQLPVLQNIKTTKTSGGLVGILVKAIAGLFDTIIQTAIKPFMDALNYFTRSTPLLTHNAAVVHLWLVSTGIADSLLVLVIALLGFHVMGGGLFGLSEINLRTLLPKLVLAFALINSSLFILDGLIELSNAMVAAIRIGTGYVSPWNSLLAITSKVSGYSLAALFILLVLLVLSVIMVIYYIGRIVVLYLGAVLAPVVILLWLLPEFKDFAENSLKIYVSTVFVLFIHVIILSLAGSLFESASSGAANPIMDLLLGLATLTALIKTQGVLMQLNYASIGPRTVRRLGGEFISGISYIGSSFYHNVAPTIRPGYGSLADSGYVTGEPLSIPERTSGSSAGNG
ncbi:MAG: type IV secretion system protein, partial [Gammaproteobacteria bacterium]|nr:type IV secretion system protein [Gammaproteobacteria bacterium]